MSSRNVSLDKTIKYSDYIGTVEYSAEDEVLYGVILGINDSITYEGRSVEELKAAFQEAVDDYLDFCKEIGKNPQRTYKGSFNVRIKPEIHQRVALEAAKKGISLNQFVEQAIMDTLKTS
ncbi:type II toxin-antitoxin system HicB family antitoxin [Anoxynatronum sibiricum]|uniref:Type II toxin-antitoxin system HicB family antitoxin n=1 Tax=Anoxynatronum sibiricum TaxID=210623 RepID=A0ABU9VZB3_9CLOT